MPQTTRHHRVEVFTTGALTLDELADLVEEARRAQIPGHTVAGGDHQGLVFVHDFDATARGAGHPDPITEVLRTPVLRPSVGDLR